MPTAPDESVSGKIGYSSQYNSAFPELPVDGDHGQGSYTQAIEPRASSAARSSVVGTGPGKYSSLGGNGVSTSDANLLLGLNASYSGSRVPSSYNQHASPSHRGHGGSPYDHSMPSVATGSQPGRAHMASRAADLQPVVGSHVGDVFIETQDIDMSTLQHQNNLPFALNGEVLPWLEYLPPDVLSYFGDQQSYSHLMSSDDGTS